MKSIAIMQPYFFPYHGYFQLLHAVDEFIFLDDVKFIKRGWINRNQFLTNEGESKYITIPIEKKTNKNNILEVKTALGLQTRKKFINKISEWYYKAPYFEQVFSLFREVVNIDSEFICDLSIHSIYVTTKYLGLKKRFDRSSTIQNSKGLKKADRIIQISHQKKVEKYINAPGGREIYDFSYFKEKGIQLKFLQTSEVTYDRFDRPFSGSLSIIDIMMFNSPETILENFLPNYCIEEM